MIDDLTAARGGGVRVVSPGELHLVEELTARGGDIAGEGNGGVVVPAVGLARDGLAAGAAIMALLARTGRRCPSSPAACRTTSAGARPCPAPGRDHACAAIEAVAAHLEGRPADARARAIAIPSWGSAWSATAPGRWFDSPRRSRCSG